MLDHLVGLASTERENVTIQMSRLSAASVGDRGGGGEPLSKMQSGDECDALRCSVVGERAWKGSFAEGRGCFVRFVISSFFFETDFLTLRSNRRWSLTFPWVKHVEYEALKNNLKLKVSFSVQNRCFTVLKSPCRNSSRPQFEGMSKFSTAGT